MYVPKWLRLNAHGDVIALGSLSYDYDAFGNQQTSNTNDTNPFRYCGEYFDDETGQIYLRARYYSSRTGRFITEDPIRDGLNWYVYCENNPIMFVDPLGLISVDDGVYSSIVQAQLMQYTYDYYNAKFLGIGNIKEAILNAANARTNRAQNTWERMWDPKAAAMENNLILATAKATDLGLKEGTDEFGLTVLIYAQVLNDIDKNAQEQYNNQLMFFALFSLSDLNKYEKANYTTNNKVIESKDKAIKWLGKDARVITNSNGDKVFISADGKRRIRFDLKHPAQHEFPHAHVEEMINGAWKKSGPIFPIDIKK